MKLYVIREIGSKSYLTSLKYHSFSEDLSEAALYKSVATAKSACTKMLNKRPMHWSINGHTKSCFAGDLQKYVKELEERWSSVNKKQYEYTSSVIEYARNNMIERGVSFEVLEVEITLVQKV